MYPRMRMVLARLMRRRLIVPWLARAYCESLRRMPHAYQDDLDRKSAALEEIIWTLQSPKTVRRTQDKDDCQQRSRRSLLIAALTRTPIRETTKDDRAPNFRMADNPWGHLLWLRLRERHARNIEVIRRYQFHSRFCSRNHPRLVPLRASLDRQVRRTFSAARSIEAITRCTATASSKLGAVRVPSRRSCAIRP
jgi:hypothetical protein